MSEHARRLEIALLLSVCVSAIAIGLAWSMRRDLADAEQRAAALYRERDVWIGNYQRLKEDR